MTNTEQRKATPPYATYKSFINLINDLRENGIPDHITRSVLNGSNSAKAMMSSTLRYLDLIDEENSSTTKFMQLINNENEYKINLNKLLTTHYAFLFNGSINLANTTTEIVQRKFQDQGASGSTVSKCIAFFLAAASDADIVVSDRVKTPTPIRSTKPKKKPPVIPPAENSRLGGRTVSAEQEIPEGMERITIPLRDFEDGIIYLPANLEDNDAKRAIKMVKFILEEYYNFNDD